MIVPVYNAERWLRRCVDSILGQTFTDFELLLVDDGSTDGSAAICDEYAALDPRVRVFHKPNGGVSSARNLGLDHARGEWLTFADADDWMESDSLKRVLQCAVDGNLDLVIADYYEDNGASSVCIRQNIGEPTKENLISNMFKHSLLGGGVTKFIRFQIIRDNNLRFNEGISYCEDFILCCQIFMLNVRIGFLNAAYYHYDCSNDSSLTRNYTMKTFNERKKSLDFLASLNDKTINFYISAWVLEIKGEAMYHNVASWHNIKSWHPLKFTEAINAIRKYPKFQRLRAKAAVYEILGEKISNFIFTIYKR